MIDSLSMDFVKYCLKDTPCVHHKCDGLLWLFQSNLSRTVWNMDNFSCVCTSRSLLFSEFLIISYFSWANVFTGCLQLHQVKLNISIEHWHNISHCKSITANLLVNNCLFIHPAETEQVGIRLDLCFWLPEISPVFSLLLVLFWFNSWEKCLAL